jgi:uncharacterized membrane protein
MDGVEKDTEETSISKREKKRAERKRAFEERKRLFNFLTPEQRKRSEERLTMLCDGVFAIVITLLVLEIRLPESVSQIWGKIQEDHPGDHALQMKLFENTWHPAWGDVLGKSMIYVITFGIIAGYWINHRRLMTLVKQHDGPFTFLTFVYLAFVAFYPAAFNLMSAWAGSQVEPVILFTLVLAGTGFSSSILWVYAGWNYRLFEKNELLDMLQMRYVYNLIPPAFFVLSLLLFYIPWFSDTPWLITLSWFLIFPAIQLARAIWNLVHHFQDKSRVATPSLGD